MAYYVRPKPKAYEGEVKRARELIAEVGPMPADWEAQVEEWFGYGEPELALFTAFDFALKYRRPVRRSVVLEAVFGWFDPISEGAGFEYLTLPTNDDVDWSEEPIDIRPKPRNLIEQTQRARHLIAEVEKIPQDLQDAIEVFIHEGKPDLALRLAYDHALRIQQPVDRLAVIETIGWLDPTRLGPQSKYLRIPIKEPHPSNSCREEVGIQAA